MLLNDLLGRKLSIMFSAVPSAIGYALMAGAHGLWMLLLGRTLTGFAGGLTAACIPVSRGLPCNFGIDARPLLGEDPALQLCSAVPVAAQDILLVPPQGKLTLGKLSSCP